MISVNVPLMISTHMKGWRFMTFQLSLAQRRRVNSSTKYSDGIQTVLAKVVRTF
jgi:hypothetical protein